MNDLLTVMEMAELLKISRSKAYSLIKEKNFPIIKIGNCIRISKQELFEYLKVFNKHDIICHELENGKEDL